MARLAIRVKVVIFFGFVGYSLMIVDEFHLGLSRESELIAWVGVPIVLANLWLTGACRGGSRCRSSPCGRRC